MNFYENSMDYFTLIKIFYKVCMNLVALLLMPSLITQKFHHNEINKRLNNRTGIKKFMNFEDVIVAPVNLIFEIVKLLSLKNKYNFIKLKEVRHL